MNLWANILPVVSQSDVFNPEYSQNAIALYGGSPVCPPITSVACVAAYIGHCGDSWDPDQTGWPTVDGNEVAPTYMCYQATYTDTDLGGCGNSYIVNRVWKVKNTNTNQTVTCIQNISLTDDEAPVLTCPDNIEVSCETDPSEFSGPPVVNDACGSSYTQNYTDSPYQACTGSGYTITRTWHVTDACGNQASCAMTIDILCRPTQQSSHIVFSGISSNQLTLSWFVGNGSKRIVVINTTNNFTLPVDGYDPFPISTTYSGNGQQVVYNEDGNTVTVNGLSSNTTYWFRVFEYSDCSGSNYYLTSTEVGNPKSQATAGGGGISITSSIIPPWQRENDSYQGSVTVSTNPASSSWHLQVKVTNAANGSTITTINYPSITSATQNFFSSDPQLAINSINGRKLTFMAVREVGGSMQLAGVTNIIEKKWNHKNVIAFNDLYNQLNNKIKIKIPIKYKPSNPITHVSIFREGNVSRKNFGLFQADGFMSNVGINYYAVGTDGYVTISVDNSNISDVFPGDFKVYVWSLNILPEEIVYFDFTKFGKILSSESPSDKIVIVIGGTFNEIEGNAIELHDHPTVQGISFSLLSALHDNNFDTWYIAQGNGNSIIRNGYDIGVAIDSIKSRNPNITEFDFVTHSKGGLDLRAYLSGFTSSYDDNSTISYQTSSVNEQIKKILFLGTPHNGANLADWAIYIPISVLLNCPATIELSSLDIVGVLDILNGLPLPMGISYANLAGYRSYIGNISYNGISGVPAYLNYHSDGLVTIYSNNFLTNHFPDNSIKQLYQNSPSLLSHILLHKETYLSQTDSYHNSLNCLSPPLFPTNLNKILEFFKGNPNPNYDEFTPFESCDEPQMTPIIINTYGSLIPGAIISVKALNSDDFYIIGNTNEQSSFVGQIAPAIHLGDSIKVTAEGYENIIFKIDSSILNIGKVEIGMFKSGFSSSHIKSPSIKFENSLPVVNFDSMNIEVKGENVFGIEINSPYNQDTQFVPLILNNSKCTITLDTGYTNLLIRFLGLNDTVILTRGIYYLPDSLFSKNTYNVILNSDSISMGAKLFINNQFVKKVSLATDTIALLTGQNTFKFSKLGYSDALIVVDSAVALNIDLSLKPITYSSLLDTAIVNFQQSGPNFYTRNISVFDSSKQIIMSMKQFDSEYSYLGLITKSRNFKFRQLNAPASGNVKVIIILDQVESLNEEDIYLLKIDNDTSFSKILDSNNDVNFNFESEAQKISYEYLKFNNGDILTQTLILINKQPPIISEKDSFSMMSGDSLIIQFSDLFFDPDSIKDDLYYHIESYNEQNIDINLKNEYFVIYPKNCFVGSTSMVISAEHDGLAVNTNIDVDVLQSLSPSITLNGLPKICYGDTLLLTASNGELYSWNNGESTQSILITEPGQYSVIVIDSNGCASSSSEVIIEELPAPTPGIYHSGPTEFCLGDSLWLSTGPASSFLWTTGDTSQFSSVNESGLYSVTTTNSNGCSGASSPLPITVYDLPIVDLGLDTLVISPYPLYAGNTGSMYEWNTTDTIQTIFAESTGWYSVTVTDVHGCKSIDSVFVQIITSLISLEETKLVRIYPNPNNGSFTLSGELPISEILQIKVINSVGNNVFSSDPEEVSGRFNKTIDLDKPSPGVYYLILRIGAKSYSGKVLIQPY